MNKTLMIDVVMQQLETLSIEELLDVRAKVDALIHNKISSVYQNQSRSGFTPTAISYAGKAQPTISSSIGTHISGAGVVLASGAGVVAGVGAVSAVLGISPVLSVFEKNPVSSPKQENNNSLEKIIELVDEWMMDESDYDQETYPQMEAALNENKLSI